MKYAKLKRVTNLILIFHFMRPRLYLPLNRTKQRNSSERRQDSQLQLYIMGVRRKCEKGYLNVREVRYGQQQ